MRQGKEMIRQTEDSREAKTRGRGLDGKKLRYGARKKETEVVGKQKKTRQRKG